MLKKCIKLRKSFLSISRLDRRNIQLCYICDGDYKYYMYMYIYFWYLRSEVKFQSTKKQFSQSQHQKYEKDIIIDVGIKQLYVRW